MGKNRNVNIFILQSGASRVSGQKNSKFSTSIYRAINIFKELYNDTGRREKGGEYKLNPHLSHQEVNRYFFFFFWSHS